VAHRLRGPRPEGAAPAADGTFVDLTAELVHHRDGRESAPFRMTSGAVGVDGRYDLVRMGPWLGGSFMEWGGGLGVGTYDYAGAVDATEWQEMLLARFGFGVYVGRGAAPRAEIFAYYDHRHDDFTGGLKVPLPSPGTLRQNTLRFAPSAANTTRVCATGRAAARKAASNPTVRSAAACTIGPPNCAASTKLFTKSTSTSAQRRPSPDALPKFWRR
jgi:hypothetical protein